MIRGGIASGGDGYRPRYSAALAYDLLSNLS